MTKATGTTKLIQSEEILNNEEFGEQLLNMAIGLNNLTLESNWQLGDIRQSILTEALFQERKGNNWVRLNGQDITGSDLDSSHGISSLPDIVSVEAVFGSIGSTESVFSIVSSQNKSHSHLLMNTGTVDANIQSRTYMTNKRPTGRAYIEATPQQTLWTYRTGYDGDSEARTNNIGINYFVKINNSPTNF